jgi:hypothetical protein
MSVWFDVARVAAGVNVVLLSVLVVIWGRNYYQLRSKHSLGLAMFGCFLLAENAFSLYIYVFHDILSDWFATGVPTIAWKAMMALHVLEAVGIAFLVWITWD